MSVNHLLIRLIGFSKQEAEHFSAILDLAETRLQHPWRITDTGKADFFVLIDEGCRQDAILSGIPDGRCLVYAQEKRYGNQILLNAGEQLPSIKSLIEALNYAQNQAIPNVPAVPITQAAATDSWEIAATPSAAPEKPTTQAGLNGNAHPTATTAQASPPLVGTDHFFDPEQGLLKALLAFKESPVWIAINKETNIWIDPIQGFYYCHKTLEDLVSYCQPDDSQLLIHQISPIELQMIVIKDELVSKPLNDLIWCAAFRLSKGRLLVGHQPEDAVHLGNWPNLRLPEGRNFIKLAAFMRNNTLSLPEIAQMTGQALGDVYNFYNACYLVDLIEKNAAPQYHEKPMDEERRDLLDRIRGRLQK